MGRLTDTVRDQVAKNAKQTPLPDWLPRFTLIVGGLFATFLVYQFIFGADPTATTARPPAPRQVVLPAGGATTIAGDDTTTSTPAPGSSGTVRDSTGAVVAVDADALSVAHLAAIATVTGDILGVPLSGEAPVLVPYPNATSPTVASTTLTSSPGGDVLTFSVSVDAGDGGPPVSRTITVTRSAERGWEWAPLEASATGQ